MLYDDFTEKITVLQTMTWAIPGALLAVSLPLTRMRFFHGEEEQQQAQLAAGETPMLSVSKQRQILDEAGWL